MAERSRSTEGYLESVDWLPDELIRATRAPDPLIRIAAGRVLRRVRWSGAAAVAARTISQELRYLRPQIERNNFVPSRELQSRLWGVLICLGPPEGRPPELFIERAIKRLREETLDQTLTVERIAAVESAKKLLETPPAQNDRVLPSRLDLLPPSGLAAVVTALFARLRDETFDDPHSEMGFENELEPLNSLRGHFVPDIEALFAVYQAFAGLVLTQWLGWLAKHGGEDPGWVSHSHLKISWQIASVASWAGLPPLLTCLNRVLRGANESEQFVALTFAELVVRIGHAGGRLKMYGGGSIASDVIEPEYPLASGSQDKSLNSPLSVVEMKGFISAKRMSSAGVGVNDEDEEVRVGTWPGSSSTAPSLDLVNCSVFGPPAAPPGETVLIQIFLHLPSQAEQASVLATVMDSSAGLKGVQTLEARIEQGARVDITLSVTGPIVEEPVQRMRWIGEPAFCQFLVTIPEGSNGRSFFPIVRIFVEGSPVGRIIFRLSSDASAFGEKPGPRGDHARRYEYVFVSYATEDRKEVLKRLQMLQITKTEFFQDVLSLRPGDRWEKELYQRISRCDLFLLFWSQAAKDSEWVMKEAEYALKRQQEDPKSEPDLVPVVLEPDVEPPPSLSAFHFNDPILSLISLMP
jgi:hypothetical protein